MGNIVEDLIKTFTRLPGLLMRQMNVSPASVRPVWVPGRPHWCPWTRSGGLCPWWSSPSPLGRSAPTQSGTSLHSACSLQISAHSNCCPWPPSPFAESTQSKETERQKSVRLCLLLSLKGFEMNTSVRVFLTSSVMMTSGYVSSDRKLKMHQILKVSSSEMRSRLRHRFLLQHRVQQILLNSIMSNSSRTCQSKLGIQSESHWSATSEHNVFTNAKQETGVPLLSKPPVCRMWGMNLM